MPAENSRAAVEAHLRFARELGIYDFYRRTVDAAAILASAEAFSALGAVDVPPEPEIAEYFSDADEQPAAATQPLDQRFEEQLIARAPVSIIATLPSQPYTGGDKVAALHALQQEIGLCMRCPLATQGRNLVVFGDGDPDAQIMFVGEGPGRDEDEQGLPFIGRGGQLLNNMIAAMGTSRQQVYIANIVKCRPPKNRAPVPVEANTCLPFLLRQYDIVQPKVVVALGVTAALYLTGQKVSLGSLRGRLHDFRQSKLLVTYHPAYLLRDPRQKKETWADLQIVMQYLGMKLPKPAANQER